MHVTSQSAVSAQACAQTPAPLDCAAEGNDKEHDCVICFEKSALFVTRDCRHLVCCAGCRRKLVHDALVVLGHSSAKAKERKALNAKELERTRICCPICRCNSRLIRHDRIVG